MQDAAKIPVLGLFAAVFAFLLLQIPLLEYIVDDAYIHLTFAENLVEHHEFSFNRGEPTNGVTAPLWTALIAFFGLIFNVSPVLAKSLSVFFGALTIPSVYRLGLTIDLDHRKALIAAFVWGVNAWLIRWSASGMETSLAILLMILAVDFQIRRSIWAGTLYGLAILCRPEAGVMLLVLVIDYYQSRGFYHAMRTLSRFFIVITFWLIVVVDESFSLIPNSFLVKCHAGLPTIADFLMGLKRTAFVIGGGHFVEIFLIISATFIALKSRITTSSNIIRINVILVIWAVFPAIIYMSMGVFVSSRYLVIGLPAVLLGAFSLTEILEVHFNQWNWNRIWKLIFLVLVVHQLVLTIFITLPHAEAFKPTHRALIKLAEILRTKTLENSVVAAGDVGIIGFASDRYVLDLEGIETTEMIPYRVGRPLDDLILKERFLQVKRPDYLIDKAMDSKRLTKAFGDRYRVMEIVPIPGGLIETANEQWYYTLYDLRDEVKGKSGSVNEEEQ